MTTIQVRPAQPGEIDRLARLWYDGWQFDALVDAYADLQEREEAWTGNLSEAELARVLETPHIPGGKCTVAEGVTQACLHSQGHRAQIAKMFRALGGTPPMTDFILWVTQRPGEDRRPATVARDGRVSPNPPQVSAP